MANNNKEESLLDLRSIRALMIRMGMKDLAVKLSHSSLARFLQGMNYSAGLRRHEGELQQVYDMLADELSRETFRAVISACKSGDYSGMHKDNSRHLQYA